MNKMDFFLYFLLIFFSVFQSCDLSKKIGNLGSTYIPFIVVISTIYLLIRYRSLKTNSFIVSMLKITILLFVINIITIYVYIVILNQQGTILGENAVVKMVKGFSYIVVILFFIINIYNLTLRFNEKKILKPFIWTFIFLFFACIFEFMNPVLFNKMFHGEYYNRIRLFTNESSFTGSIIMVYGSLSLYYCFNYLKKILPVFILIIIFFIYTSASKGFLLVLLISGILYLLTSKIKIKYKIILLFIIVILSNLILPNVIKELQGDIKNYSSFSTRVYSILIAVMIMFKYPFGVGNFIYLNIYPRELKNYLYLLTNKGLNISEINMYIYAKTDEAIAAKSGIFQYGLYWGIIGTILFLTILFKVYSYIKKSKNKYKGILVYTFMFLIISIFTYINFDIKYEIWSFFIVSLVLSRGFGNVGRKKYEK